MTVEAYVRDKATIDPPSEFATEFAEKSGVFVCIKKHGQLRGCIGTFLPCTEDVASETVRNAVAAASQDPRFEAVREEELDSLEYVVDVLSPPEKIEDSALLDPKRYGVIVSKGGRRGLLLPDLEGVNTIGEQLRIAKMKAGLGEDEEVDLFRFTVERCR